MSVAVGFSAYIQDLFDNVFGFHLPAAIAYPAIPAPGAPSGIFNVPALVFSLGIIVLFSSLGLVATAILGPFGAIQLGSNVWVNAFLTVLFLGFGLSLLGAFEITIPSSVLTRVDRASQRGGILGTLLMGLAFSLTAFACVGPFVGTLLAGSLTSGGIRPLAGMVAFASGLALPFFGLALAMRGQQISDFPLCNKSFNLSYCGHDL